MAIQMSPFSFLQREEEVNLFINKKFSLWKEKGQKRERWYHHWTVPLQEYIEAAEVHKQRCCCFCCCYRAHRTEVHQRRQVKSHVAAEPSTSVHPQGLVLQMSCTRHHSSQVTFLQELRTPHKSQASFNILFPSGQARQAGLTRELHIGCISQCLKKYLYSNTRILFTSDHQIPWAVESRMALCTQRIYDSSNCLQHHYWIM